MLPVDRRTLEALLDSVVVVSLEDGGGEGQRQTSGAERFFNTVNIL
jgi:hypothetical protein